METNAMEANANFDDFTIIFHRAPGRRDSAR